jgi:hypothetical protein
VRFCVIPRPFSLTIAMLRRFVFAAALLLAALSAIAQSPAPLPRPDLDVKISGEVMALARTPGGGVVLGGRFDSVNGVPRANLARLQADGTLDLAWNPGANDEVSALAVAPDGAVYAAGPFTRAGGLERAGLVKLAAQDGRAVAAWRSPLEPAAGLRTKGFSMGVYALAVDAGGALYVGGDFPFGNDSRHLARLTADTGAADPAWADAPDPVNAVLALAVDADAVYAGGAFGFVGETERANLAKFARAGGKLATDFAPAVSSMVRALARHGEWLYLAGEFNSIGEDDISHLARVAATDGAVDPRWKPAPDSSVDAVAVDADGAVYAGGSFFAIGGAEPNRFAKLSDTDGRLVDGWTATIDNPHGGVFALATTGTDGEHVAVGGEFSRFGGATRLGLAMLDATGAVGPRSDAEAPGWVTSVARQPDGGLVVGGYFDTVDGQPRGNLLRLKADGSFDSDWRVDADSDVVAVAADSTGRVYVAGSFLTLGGVAATRLARVEGDGVVDPQWKPAPNSGLHALALDGDDRLYVAGDFTTMAGLRRIRLARFTADGALDDWAPYYPEVIFALATDATHLYIGGYGDLVRVAFDATEADNTWIVDQNNRVQALAVAGGQVYVGGNFTTLGFQDRHGLARVPANGPATVDAAWDPGSEGASVSALLPLGDALYVGGAFDALGGAPHPNLAKLALDSGVAQPWNPKPLGFVNALAVFGAGDVLAAGDFTRMGNRPRETLAALPSVAVQIFADGFED